LVNTRKL